MNGGYEPEEYVTDDLSGSELDVVEDLMCNERELSPIQKAMERALAEPIVISTEMRFSIDLSRIWSTPLSPKPTRIEDVRLTSIGGDVSEDTEK